MYCRNCGKEVDEKAEYCLNCGVRPLKSRNYCQNCGAGTTEVQDICLRCGVKLSSTVITLDTDNDTLLLVLCILLPPVAVWLKTGNSGKVLLNIILCFLLAWFGGVLHAFLVRKVR
ncbi:YqaE/Pmp3 family membrane protein [Marispirochaeta aestuarii]|uniref:YqaE/Pmp3 family membrane protein n=1 Tax=Marispirochaeta aestuarii TaxID=1963862 RepID=UPI00117804F0|nr:YqaE/Pmp3 family membrane protein [Marispirochaeta aestuarii]